MTLLMECEWRSIFTTRDERFKANKYACFELPKHTLETWANKRICTAWIILFCGGRQLRRTGQKFYHTLCPRGPGDTLHHHPRKRVRCIIRQRAIMACTQPPRSKNRLVYSRMPGALNKKLRPPPTKTRTQTTFHSSSLKLRSKRASRRPPSAIIFNTNWRSCAQATSTTMGRADPGYPEYIAVYHF